MVSTAHVVLFLIFLYVVAQGVRLDETRHHKKRH